MSLDITLQQQLVYNGRGWEECQDVYVRIHKSLITSGLLAELDGKALKAFLALGLQATTLIDGDLYDYLEKAELVAEKDKGRLFCYIAQEDLASQVGMSRERVGEKLNLLVDCGLIEKRLVRGLDGRFLKPVFFITGQEVMSKFGSPNRVTKRHMVNDTPSDNSHRVTFRNTVGNTMLRKPDTENVTVLINTAATAAADGGETEIFQLYLRLAGIEREPTGEELEVIRQLLTDGISHETIQAGVERAFRTRRRSDDAPTLNQCARVVRRLHHREHREHDTETTDRIPAVDHTTGTVAASGLAAPAVQPAVRVQHAVGVQRAAPLQRARRPAGRRVGRAPRGELPGT